MNTTTAAPYRWGDIEPELVSPLITRQLLWGRALMLARVELKGGATVPMHRHENEQWSWVQQGTLRFLVGEARVPFDVGSGAIMYLPSGVPHEVHVLEDTVTIDVFSPPREDWIHKTDSYLRGGS